jgi:preprotein translocase subunit SecA
VSVLERLLSAGEGRTVRRLEKLAKAINALEEEPLDWPREVPIAELTDEELRSLTDHFKERLEDGETLDDLLPEAFMTVREAASRVLKKRHYDVQLMGGAALHMGNIAEMKTGEGKTLVSTLPAYLNALSGKGVHIVTVNDYLAQRDADWMGAVHKFLGLTVGVVLPTMSPEEHRQAYECDITYGTNNEFGFDYLRDNMAWSTEDMVQRGHNFAIVDEVDSILIDEARTPLIISGPADFDERHWYTELARICRRMKGFDSTTIASLPPQEQDARRAEINHEYDYEYDPGKRTVAVTEKGVALVEDQLGIESLYESARTNLVGHLNNAIKAKELYKRDKDYIIQSGEVLIVDEFTGRILHGRRYNEGMHQAIEAKEGVEIKQENQTLATITLQNYFRLYDKLSGMTGTAQTEAAEFNKVYKIGVVTIPTNMPMVREDRADVIYKTEKAKFEAVVEDIAERHEAGQPILVGTVSVEKSELLSTMLRKRGITHSVLNAKYHAREAEIVAQAGRKGAVTVATNMAGRGTDILLGGNPEFTAAAKLRNAGITAEEDPEGYEDAYDAALEEAEKECADEAAEVIDAGGLYVLGTERHESRRIDNQLRGRSGRQGDPGESRFYLSLRDELMLKFRAGAVEAVMERLNIPDEVPIESKMVSRQIRSAQAQIEQQNAEIRKNVLKYDEVLNKQRQVIYAERNRVLDGEDVHDYVDNMIDDVITAYVVGATSDGYAEDWDLDTLWSALKQLYPVSITIDEVEEEAGGREAIDVDFLTEQIRQDATAAYERREEELGSEVLRELERQVLLQVIDRKWREHLYEMDYLQEGVNLRAYGQRDPLVEYQREGYAMFQQMLEGIKEEVVGFLFNLEVQVEEPGAEPAAEQAESDVMTVESFAEKVGEAADAMAAGEADEASSHVEIRAKGLGQRTPQNLQYSQPIIDGAAGSGSVETGQESAAAALGLGPTNPIAAGEKHSAPGQKVGSGPSRNAPCPCGSGRKYKRCHGAPGAAPLP